MRAPYHATSRAEIDDDTDVVGRARAAARRRHFLRSALATFIWLSVAVAIGALLAFVISALPPLTL